jgi:hypothetical protein
MKTQIDKGQQEGGQHDIEVIKRVSISQRCVMKFPFFAYNVGQNKLIFKNTLKDGASFVLEIPKSERFRSFANFNTFEDLGFFPNELNIEMCTNLVYLTQETGQEALIVNILLMDPYYDVCQIALLRSTTRFELWQTKKYQDVMIQNFLYCYKFQGDTEYKLMT